LRIFINFIVSLISVLLLWHCTRWVLWWHSSRWILRWWLHTRLVLWLCKSWLLHHPWLLIVRFDSSITTVLAEINFTWWAMVSSISEIDHLLTVVACRSVIWIWVSSHEGKDMATITKGSSWWLSAWCIGLRGRSLVDNSCCSGSHHFFVTIIVYVAVFSLHHECNTNNDTYTSYNGANQDGVHWSLFLVHVRSVIVVHITCVVIWTSAHPTNWVIV